MKQTAVEWLIEQIEIKNGKEFSSYYSEFIEQAKAMEKEQIIDAYTEGYDIRDDMGSLSTNPTGKEYYNETFKKD